ncbi:lipoprotein LpqH [Nocardia camponoti]|uniref:Lipoprotein LpqH n=1 Tax=Nocardia camponoti TaxID=1616106 RepID=A0A917VA39_9NOCA|nr:lipoprotein LpqH [Nocardia camponoti]GGK53458.1 hypothetical protein GCM10011591_26620 [Nocardia camponoti]
MNIKLIAAFAATATALLVTGCSDTGATTVTPGTPGNSAGKSTATIDGKEIAAKFDTTCAKQGDTIALALTDQANATYGTLSVSASIVGDTVQAVAIGGSQGGGNGLPYAVGYGNGQPGGSATLTKKGTTFQVTGEGVSADMTNPLAGVKTSKFDITFACTSVVGA